MIDSTPDLKTTLQTALSQHLTLHGYELIDLTSIPTRGDRMVRILTLEEALTEFDTARSGQLSSQVAGYLIQIRPKSRNTSDSPENMSSLSEILPKNSDTPSEMGRPVMDGIYLATGKLNLPFLTQNAELLFKAGEYALTRNIFKAILQSSENSGLAHYWIGRCHEAEGNLEEAEISYEESLTYHPSLETYRHYSIILIRRGKDQEAAELIERALFLKDLDAQDRFELYKTAGNCWMRCNCEEKAESHYHQALSLDPMAEEIQTNLGALYLKGGKITEAKRCFQDAVAANPRNEKSLAGLGTCLFELGEKKLAHDYLALALDIDPKNPVAISYLIRCAYELKNYAMTSKILRNYVMSGPVNIGILYSLAGIEFQMGKLSEAKASAQNILNLQPGHAGALELVTMINRYAGTADSLRV